MKKATILLQIGLALVAAILGGILGASATPVAYVVIPALFALVAPILTLTRVSSQLAEMTAIKKELGSLRNQEAAASKDLAKKVTAAGDKLSLLNSNLTKSAEQAGIGLILFAILFCIGFAGGSWARSKEILNPAPSWVTNTAVSTQDAVRWTILQHQLFQMGLSHSAVESLFKNAKPEKESSSEALLGILAKSISLLQTDKKPEPNPPSPPDPSQHQQVIVKTASELAMEQKLGALPQPDQVANWVKSLNHALDGKIDETTKSEIAAVKIAILKIQYPNKTSDLVW